MRVEQAIYGEVRGGHALRLTSDHGRVATELASRLDLPDTAPPGIDWSPFISGFSYGDKYILARTFSDSSAPRAGMVLTHAIIAPLSEMVTIADLRPLFKLLITEPKSPDSLHSMDVQASTNLLSTNIDLTSVAEALVTRGNGPVVRIGTAGFEELIVALWFRIWPTFRSHLTFRLSFGPHDIIETPNPLFVCTPISLATRWVGHRIVGVSEVGEVSHAAAILSGGADATTVLRFAENLGIRLEGFADLPLLARAYELANAPSSNISQCITLLRLVERLSPDPKAGTVGKEIFINMLCSQLHSASVEEILLLRNLSTTGFSTATVLWDSLQSWMAANKFTNSDDNALLQVIDDALSASTAVESWRKAILSGFKAASSGLSSSFPIAFWRWAHIRPTTLARLFDHIFQVNGLEARLSRAVPQEASRDACEAVMTLASSKKLLLLHGIAVGTSLNLKEAVCRQTSIDTDPTYLEGIKASIRRVTPEHLLEFALETTEPRILSIVAEYAANNPQLLKNVDFSSESAQIIWSLALNNNANVWQGLADPEHSFITVIRHLLDSGQASSELVTKLSVTPLADISRYTRCQEVWLRLAEPARSNLLKATANGWLKRTSLGEFSMPDPQLESAILASGNLSNTLRALTLTDIGIAIRMISSLSNYDESDFLRWQADWPSMRVNLTVIEAEALGHVLLERRWQRAVEQLVRFTRMGHNDIKPALRICIDMISILTQWLIGLSSASDEDKWRAFEEIATELYPQGPDESELWDRADGLGADLRNYGTGRSKWRYAITLIKRGSGPRLAKLLYEMRRDFPTNEQLSYLGSDSGIGDWF